jgi:hypothetical protein
LPPAPINTLDASGSVPPFYLVVPEIEDSSSIHVSLASADTDQGSHSASVYTGIPISLFPDDMSALNIPYILGLQPPTTALVPVSQINASGMDPMVQILQVFQTMFHKQDQDRIVDRAERQRFEATIQALVSPTHHKAYVSSPEFAGPDDVPPVQYGDAPQVSVTGSLPIRGSACRRGSTLFPRARPSSLVEPHQHRYDHDRPLYDQSMSRGIQTRSDEPPFLAVLAKTSHCSKFKKCLEESAKLSSDSLTVLELFVDGIKSALDMMLCYHYSFAPYIEWALDYLVTTTLCPPALQGHPRYQAMCINYNAFGLVLHSFLWSGTPISFGSCPASYH